MIDMEAGRRKIRFCILTAVLTAVVLGACYYVFGEEESKPDATDVLVKQEIQKVQTGDCDDGEK